MIPPGQVEVHVGVAVNGWVPLAGTVGVVGATATEDKEEAAPPLIWTLKYAYVPGAPARYPPTVPPA